MTCIIGMNCIEQSGSGYVLQSISLRNPIRHQEPITRRSVQLSIIATERVQSNSSNLTFIFSLVFVLGEHLR